MAMLIPMPGVALLIESPARDGEHTKHLHVLLTGTPTGRNAAAQLVIVPVTSVRNTQLTDYACVLEVGDHRFIRHSSFVYYAKARQVTPESLQRGLDSGVMHLMETLSDDVLQRVITGAFTTDRIPLDVLSTLARAWPEHS